MARRMNARIPDRKAMALKIGTDARKQIRLIRHIDCDLQAFTYGR